MTTRNITPFIARTPGTVTRVITAKVTAVNTTTRTATLEIGVDVFYPASLGAVAVNDVLWMIDSNGYLWPFAYHR